MLFRLVLLYMCCFMFSKLEAQSLLDKRISLHLENVQLTEALEVISTTIDGTFSYSNDQIPLEKKVTIIVDNVRLKTALDQLFLDMPIIYKEIGNQITLRRSTTPNEIKLSNQLAINQKLTQVVRGIVKDADAHIPLVGVSVWIEGGKGTSTDEKGRFAIKDVPVGRQNINASYLGYEPYHQAKVMIISGKELVLDIKMREAPLELAEIEVEAVVDKTRPLNEFAATSARSFSVEETGRYAAGFLDPARMAMNFAGVSLGGADDLDNQVSVRGNTPRANIWRIEGVDIPNPNHYSNLGGSGGGISLLSSSILTYSDFYTGGFPAGFGNALGGVFDVRLRKGNDEQKEYSIMVGTIGLEASAEGPMLNKKGASYLVNYRYSTLGILNLVGLNPVQDEDTPDFQDISFKFQLPTKRLGTFSLFGLGGLSNASRNLARKGFTNINPNDNDGYVEQQFQGTFGLSNKLLISDNSYLHSVFVLSSLAYIEREFLLDNNMKERVWNREEAVNTIATLTSNYTHKLNAKHTIRLGLNWSHRIMDLYYEDFDIGINPQFKKGFIENIGATDLVQAYGHWKFRIGKKWTMNTGLHGSYFHFNKNYSIEPRLAIQYMPSKKQTFSASVGRHSKLPHEAFYFYEGMVNGDSIRPNKDLDMTKSIHFIAGYDHRFNSNFRLKVEGYYQHLYNVPTTEEFGGVITSLNGDDVWDLIQTFDYINAGKGRNYGIDFTLEKFFSQQYYFLLTSSLFESKVTPFNGQEYNTRFSNNYKFNLVIGKEFKVGKRKNAIIGINGRFIFEGGMRYTPIDLPRSRELGYAVRFARDLLSEKHRPYKRLDIGINYKINRTKLTHSISIDVQNATNQRNVFSTYYHISSQSIRENTHNLIIPILNYRMDF